MYVILICTYFKKLDLVPRLNLKAYIFQYFIHSRIEYRSTVLRRKHQVV